MHFINKKHTSNTRTRTTSTCTHSISFKVPSNCKINPKPLISSSTSTNLIFDYAKSWKFNDKSFHEQGFGFVAVLYPDPIEKTLKVASHIRNKRMKAGSGKLGLPGGHVDKKGEILIEDALRELKEEAMQGQNSIKTTDLHWISASKYNVGGDRISGLFVLFVNDTKAIAGPMQRYANEMDVDAKQGFDQNTRHRFIKWRLNRAKNASWLHTDDNPGLQSTTKLWFSTMKSLTQISQQVQCTFD